MNIFDIEVKELDIPNNLIGIISTIDAVAFDLNTGNVYRFDPCNGKWNKVPNVTD